MLASYTDMFGAYGAWAEAAIVFVVSLVVLKLFQMVVLSRLKAFAKKTQNDVDDIFVDIISSIRPGLYLIISVYLGLQPLTLPDWADQTVAILFILIVSQFVIKSVIRLLDFFVTKYVDKQEEEVGEQHAEHTESMLRLFRVILQIVLWTLVLLFILSNQGVNITSLIASLGIGGIAVALALQNVLGDVFGSFFIFLDTPFKVGDYIKFGDQDGIVEKVGVRSTRIRTLLGEQLIVPNQQIVSAEIQNFRRMQRRREVMHLGVVYELSGATLKQIPTMLEEIISSVEHCTFDRSHFANFGDSALMFETVYYIDVPDYNTYMDAKQEINLKVFEAFEQAGIGFAYPTQTVFVQK